MSKDNKEKEVKMDQDGKMINPHNPEFITKVPWYLGNSGIYQSMQIYQHISNIEFIIVKFFLGPTLKHHSIQKRDHFLSLAESDELIRSKIDAQKVILKYHIRTAHLFEKIIIYYLIQI
jgi:pre-mRNA-processing factor SLU7